MVRTHSIILVLSWLIPLGALQSAEKSASANSRESDREVGAPIIRLWPIEMVGGEGNRLKEEYRKRKNRKQICGVRDPNLTVYTVKSEKPTPAIVYCPGGAYMVLGIPPEDEIKKWHDLGVGVFLKRAATE